MARKPKKKGKTYWRKKCDELWAIVVKHNGVCEICDNRAKVLHAHHLIGRSNYKYRHDPLNGVALCCQCHLFNDKCSAHASTSGAVKFLETLKLKWPARYEWFMEHRNDKQMEDKSFEETYLELKDMLTTFE